MVKNSLRQLFRTKVKTCLFFVLITLCALLICLGCNMVKQCQENMVKFKSVFTTIGTVEQEPITYTRRERYNAETKGYTYYTSKEYGEIFSLSELDMEGVTYLSGPERRAFYSVYLPDYQLLNEREGFGNDIVVEASPVEDCIPNGPVKMRITKDIASIYHITFELFYLCDHYNDHPQKLYADKTYIMAIMDFPPHGWSMGNPENNPFEYVPRVGPYSEQTTADGTKLPSVIEGDMIEEVNEEFYAKGHDQYWLAYGNELEKLMHKFSVTATDNLNLIMAFYNNDVTIAQGSTLEKEDFEQGNTVCLLSDLFARRNNIQIGDKITLPLRFADYANPAIFDWSVDPLTADGKNFEPFFTAEYTVKGIYQQLPGGGTDTGYTLDENEIIIPRKSITVDDSNNIAIYGDHISPYNTSFQIPNGTIDEFMEEWEKKGIDDVTIHFYDKGYSKLMDGIEQMERMATFLLVAGIIMTILVLVFFCTMMIGGQKKRTAIERSLGSSKWQCIRSLLTGILLVAAIGCLIGCFSGAIMTHQVSSAMANQEIFDRTYSAGIVYSKVETEQAMNGDFGVSLVTFLGVFSVTIAIAGLSAWKNLKEEPLALLSRKEK